MQKFFDLLAHKFAEAVEKGFTLVCDRMEHRLAHVDDPKARPVLENGKRKVVAK